MLPLGSKLISVNRDCILDYLDLKVNVLKDHCFSSKCWMFDILLSQDFLYEFMTNKNLGVVDY